MKKTNIRWHLLLVMGTEFNKMPFRLTGAPVVFQRLMNAVLSGLIGNTCFVYLDDIVIHSKTIEEHKEKLIKVFDRLNEHKLLLQPDKCNFFMTQIKYLGHVISGDGVKSDPDKINVVVNYPVPETLKQIKAFLGLVDTINGLFRTLLLLQNH